MTKSKSLIEVRIRYESTPNEMGAEENLSGDSMIELHINGSRQELANELRTLARTIAHTVGDPIESTRLIILMRRPPNHPVST